jgi:hypothetical protein
LPGSAGCSKNGAPARVKRAGKLHFETLAKEVGGEFRDNISLIVSRISEKFLSEQQFTFVEQMDLPWVECRARGNLPESRWRGGKPHQRFEIASNPVEWSDHSLNDLDGKTLWLTCWFLASARIPAKKFFCPGRSNYGLALHKKKVRINILTKTP